ncbi:MAG: SMC family ATPase [Anaerolineae bacterium]
MIPLKLELKNFMAYREPDALDFAGLHTVVLTGENGAGKSTLLDAITWAIWGEARGRRNDELISQGETEMRVLFVFSENGKTYRISRVCKLGKASKAKAATASITLEFLVDNDSGFTTLTEQSVRETQAKIEREINLGYETFINTAYLKQGRADEFTVRSPAERKTLLAEMLKLDVWQGYEQKAKERLDETARELEIRQTRLKEIETDMARLPEAEQELQAAQDGAAAAQTRMNESEAEVAALNKLREQARAAQTNIAGLQTRAGALAADLSKISDESRRHREALAAYQEAIGQREQIETGFARHEAARAELDALNLKLASMVELNTRKTKAEAEIADARRAIESERDGLKRRAQETERLADDAKLRQEFEATTRELNALVEDQQAQTSMNEYLSSLREQHVETKSQNDELRRKMGDLKERIAKLGRVGAICPTCGRELAEPDRVRILADWNADGKRMGDEHRANQTRLDELIAERKNLEDKLAGLEASLRKLPGIQREHAAQETRLAQAASAAQELPPLREQLSKTESALNQNAYANAARAALQTVMDELNALGYDGKSHAQLRDVALPALRGFVERKTQLDRAEIGVQAERSALESLELREKDARAQNETAQTEMARWQAELAALEKDLTRAPQAEANFSRARNEYFAAQRKVGEANQKVQACKNLEGTRARFIGEVTALRQRQSLLGDLREAFGKNGAPALIVETILPQLEANANDLLGRMTNGRMNVRFETQRVAQTGNVSETLELRISDELGERAYEMFSGGEAFRINFAVRIALSKLLAHRAGAQLQTLFIDEGFGTQDALGRERLIEAIRLIEDDFTRVFIITHIDELKDAFPSRIEVFKTARGSVARVV